MPAPTPGVTSGRFTDLQVAQDIIAWNQQAVGSSSFRRTDRISRWDLPVRVYLADPIERDRVTAALDYWQSAAGLTYVLLTSESFPRMLIRQGTDGLAAQGGGRGVLDGTFNDNSARSGLAVFEPGGGQYCPAFCSYLYRHEIGHVLGFLDHGNDGLMSGTTCCAPDLGVRSRAMITALYSLPHGARVEADGTWRVLP